MNPIDALDDRGVSPVIGVILMVSITVVLAAVLGAFALNSFDTGSNSPTASFSYEYNDSTVTITHVSGDSVDANQLRVAGDNLSAGASLTGWSGQIQAGDTATVSRQTTKDSFELEIFWRSQDGDTTARLASTSGADR